MSSSPLVSIVLPCYNGARYLGQAVESCLAQSYRNWELIIVDDASSDATPEIIARFRAADPRIRTLRHDTNRKLPAALNTGFQQSRGEYLTWTSDDNCYRPQALEEMVSLLEADPTVGLTFSDYSIIDEQGNEVEIVSAGEPEMLHLLNCIGPSFLYRRAVAERTGNYCDTLFLVEDYDYWLRVFSSFRLQPLHRNLYLFRSHANSLTRQRQKQISLALERLLTLHLAMIGVRGRGILFETHLRICRLALDNGRPMVAVKHLAGALMKSPEQFLRRVASLADRRRG